MLNQKIRMNKRQFRIGELSKKLKVKKFVIRFWEKEFGLKSERSDGGQRFYNQEDLKKFFMIKDLLYNQKFTIPGARKQLESAFSKPKENIINPATKFIEKETKNIVQKTVIAFPKDILERLKVLKAKLIQFKNKL
jgi:DNA-binding transcriptional MerR regulator